MKLSDFHDYGVEFIDNEYARQYVDLINKRLETEPKDQYFEGHHSVPKSFGGVNSKIVKLTYKEHLKAHWLLTKFIVGKFERSAALGLSYTASIGKNKKRGKVIEDLTDEILQIFHEAKVAAKNKGLSEETKAKMRKPKSEETKAKMKEAAKSRKPVSEEARRKMSEKRKGVKKGPQSPEHIAKRAAARRGQKHTEESKALMSAKLKGKKMSPEAISKREETKRRKRLEAYLLSTE